MNCAFETVSVPNPPWECWTQRGGSQTGPQFKRQFIYGSGTATALHVNWKVPPGGTCLFVSGASTIVGWTQPIWMKW